jgi:hypothetical protein
MKTRLVTAVALVLGAAACDHKEEAKVPSGAAGVHAMIASGGLKSLLESNARLVGFLNDVEQPYVYASFRDGWLEWSTDKQGRSLIQGRADTYSRPDMNCLGFEYKRLGMPGRAERYLVCEALDELKVSNVLPRSQDFVFEAGALFLEYEPPKEVGYPQYYFLRIQK